MDGFSFKRLVEEKLRIFQSEGASLIPVLNWELLCFFFFFFQVTNQMITACKNYITEHGYKTVWEYQQEELIEKLKNCIRLNEEYQRCFQKTKQRLEQNSEERQFEFSEMYIFGKSNTFSRRLHKIIDMLDTMKAFSCLGESRIEGMEQLWNKFVLIVTTMKKKPYDLLDYRKMDFDADFEEFKRQINDLQVQWC